MSKELHLWTAGADPYIFAVADVTVYVHAGTRATDVKDAGGGDVSGDDPTPDPIVWQTGNTDLAAIVWDPGHTDVVSVVDSDDRSQPGLASVLDESASTGETQFTYPIEGDEESSPIASLLGGLSQASADDLSIHVVPREMLNSDATPAGDSTGQDRDG